MIFDVSSLRVKKQSKMQPSCLFFLVLLAILAFLALDVAASTASIRAAPYQGVFFYYLYRLDHMASGSSPGNVAQDVVGKSTEWKGTTVSGEHAFPDPEEAAKELRDSGYKGAFQALVLFPNSGVPKDAGPLLFADYIPGFVTNIRAKIKNRKLDDSHIIEPLKKLTKQVQYARMADFDVGLDKWWKEKDEGLTLITREEPLSGDDAKSLRVIDAEETLRVNEGKNAQVRGKIRAFINDYTGKNEKKRTAVEWRHVALIQKFSQITDALHRPCQD
ncbi:uncharacterized protein N7483_003095 [Penicillium malachiteum]|uniref:uncharacterized protein n=1 Tax=Penicillium malachiteum TaxID=1324776 RepID=UPI002549A06A|nr:uncharacterized protein N7483_003095 [Penicillium malachiteum]KAJ5728587.1 hypothetical protein N7483_003095 [Penicillium malachiteum]